MMMGSEPEPILPALINSEKKQLSETIAIKFSQPDWQKIEQARKDFAWCRWAEPQAIKYRPFESRIKGIASAASALQIALSGEKPRRKNTQTNCIFDKTSVLLWREIAVGEGSPFPLLFELVTMLHRLGKASNRALERTQHWSEKNAWEHDWDMFVHSLASVIEGHGVKPTAAKSSNAKNPKLSPFVAFMWAIIGTLPLDLRAHTHSQQAMAKAVAKSLKFYRSRSGERSAGPNI
jgi:hypothetical protein